MKVKKSSWHWKFLNGEFSFPPSWVMVREINNGQSVSSCRYFSTIAENIIAIVVMVAAAGATGYLLGWFLTWIIWEPMCWLIYDRSIKNLPEGVYVILGFTATVVCTFSVGFLMHTTLRKHLFHQLANFIKPRGFVKYAFDSVYNKMCTKVVVED